MIRNFAHRSTVCPSCSNALVVSRISSHNGEGKPGNNRFECRTCPYQFVIAKRYYDRKPLKLKDVDDVVGGRDAWQNVDQIEGKLLHHLKPYTICLKAFMRTWADSFHIVNCVNDKCDSTKAFWYQLQIRSADEPMTTFYKVRNSNS
jgi:DNA-directed RNA polymerase III subunit RPC11